MKCFCCQEDKPKEYTFNFKIFKGMKKKSELDKIIIKLKCLSDEFIYDKKEQVEEIISDLEKLKQKYGDDVKK